MARYVKGGSVGSIAQVNAEFEKIKVAIDDTLSRKADSPNQMEGLLDMNSNPVINLVYPANPTSPIRLTDVNQLIDARIAQLTPTVNVVQSTNTISPNKSFETIAHRGFKGSNQEHTMLAYTTAVRQGADALELDLQITLDGVVVVFHDALMEDKTNLTGTIASKTLIEVRAATYDAVQSSAIYENLKIPTLTEVIQYAKEVDVKLFIEIKGIRTFADIALMINQVKDAGMLSRSTFTSFQFSHVVEARRVNADVEVGLIGGAFEPDEYIPLFNNLSLLGGKLIIVWNNPSLINHPDVGEYARGLGIDIAAYTLTNSTSVRNLVALGITRIIADVPLRGR